jgi:hypothetical protein
MAVDRIRTDVLEIAFEQGATPDGIPITHRNGSSLVNTSPKATPTLCNSCLCDLLKTRSSIRF